MSYIDDAERRIEEERQRWQRKKLEDAEKARKKAIEQSKRNSDNSLLW